MISTFFRQTFGSQLRRNMSSGVIFVAINIIMLLVSYPIYLHFLGYEKYGLWLILATVLGFAQLGLLGVNQAVMKLVAEDYGRGDIKGIQSYVMMAILMLAATGMTALTVILVFRTQIVSAFGLSGENAKIVFTFLPYIGLLSVYVFLVLVLVATLSGIGRMDQSNYIQAVGRLTAVGLSVLLLFRGGGVESLLIGNAFSYLVVHIVSVVMIRRQANLQLWRLSNWDGQRMKKLLSFGTGVFGGSLINMLLDPFNRLILSRYAGPAAVPIYDIAFRGAMQVRSIWETGLRAMMPEVSRINAAEDTITSDRITSINRKAVRLIFVLGVPTFAVLFVFADILLKVWLRASFVDGLIPAFRIMIVASFISLVGVPAYYTHMGCGRVRHCFISMGIQSLINMTIVIIYAIVAPEMVASRIFYAVMLGMLASTAYLLWQLKLYSKDINNESFCENYIDLIRE